MNQAHISFALLLACICIGCESAPKTQPKGQMPTQGQAKQPTTTQPKKTPQELAERREFEAEIEPILAKIIAPASTARVQSGSFAYSHESSGDEKRDIACIHRPLSAGKKTPCFQDTRQRTMTPVQVERLMKTVTNSDSYGPWLSAKCHNPRHAFEFQDASGEAWLSIKLCFECNNTIIERQTKDGTWEMILSTTGLTKEGRGALLGLCKELQLEKCPKD